MLSFKEFSLLLKEQKKSEEQGTYIMAELNQESKDKLFEFVSALDIPNKADPEQYHATIIYSRKPVDASDYKFDDKIEAKITGWKIFPTQSGKSCLVGIVNSKKLTEYHNDLVNNYGATHDFPDYYPHITISYDLGSDKAPKELPKFKVTFDKVTVKLLDLNFTPKSVD